MTSNLDEARKHFFQGIEHFEAGRLEPARAAFEASLAHAPGRPSVLGNLGITLFHLRRLDEAVPLLQQATAADPAYADAWTCLGLAQAGRSRWQDAVDALDKASELLPQKADLLVHKGQCLLRLGRAPEALQTFDRAVAADPQHADAWSARGSLLRELHQLDEAAKCFEKALVLGADSELTGYYLASVKGTATPPPPPRRYVESLFDDYAAEFQDHVVGKLRYQGYERLLRPLVDEGRRFRHALDLGCGTGLCGPLIRPLVDVLDGVDISQAMLDQTRQLGIYRELVHADIGSYLESAQGQVDLVMAADVFIYVGDLANVFREIRRLLTPGGRFVFTVEAPANDDDLQLLPSLRYAHSERYIRRLAEANGFRVDDIARAPIRYDQAQPVEGLYVYLG
ncbi:MAG TPA: tetratricopeptide repeat protein [Noviherbaspirillum sp.]|jgi:predicted TPR repeat methyltransferase|uniref:tetratricopeptide repeat protein n=1 Tax=Noviherbaspirillum sp. TaxID=1926288 RepID=UPI002DDDADA1|nr:tetratricopeptide repeat protein [Noviherbaspirillum sp.]HEV2609227.1 tetratricopeptide repeat protein [Noviherbaspirillum sp.]